MLSIPYTKARDIIKKYGTGYYRATFLFPKKIREATWIYYQFVRTADEFVDDPTVQDPTKALRQFEALWENVRAGATTPIFLYEYTKVLVDYQIPREYTDAFLSSMEQDLTVSRYATYEDLETYMHGSAVVIGYTMSHLIGYTEGALPYAKALGEAFQMTNFLRDIAEDYKERGRIYLPQEDMQRFGVTEAHIARAIVDESWRALMKFEMARTRALYKKGVEGIKYLDHKGQRAVYASALIYKEILDKIEGDTYDVFSKRLVVSSFRKTMLLCKALWKRNQ